MNSKKNKYLTKLITSYSLVLVIVLILGVIFHFILAHNVKQELLNENMLSLKNVTEQYSNCYANIYLISKRMANNTSLSRLAEADQGERVFYVRLSNWLLREKRLFRDIRLWKKN